MNLNDGQGWKKLTAISRKPVQVVLVAIVAIWLAIIMLNRVIYIYFINKLSVLTINHFVNSSLDFGDSNWTCYGMPSRNHREPMNQTHNNVVNRNL